MAVEKQITTIDEFERFIAQPEHRGHSFELINGEIIEKMSTEEHGLIAAQIVAALIAYLKNQPLGRAGVEIRYRFPDDDRNDLIPDVSYISNERALPITKKGAVPLMPDLAVEVKSPDDSNNELRAKAIYYLKSGSEMVWLVFPTKQKIEVYTEEMVITLGIDDVLDGGEVLPGFSLSVSELFE